MERQNNSVEIFFILCKLCAFSINNSGGSLCNEAFVCELLVNALDLAEKLLLFSLKSCDLLFGVNKICEGEEDGCGVGDYLNCAVSVKRALEAICYLDLGCGSESLEEYGGVLVECIDVGYSAIIMLSVSWGRD